MATMAFDTLRYARSLKEAGVPEPQAEVQAELMAEAFGFYADNLLTRDHFTEVLNARFGEFAALMDRRFAEQAARFEQRCSGIDERCSSIEVCIDKRCADLEVRFDKRCSDLESRIDKRCSTMEATFERRFAKVDRSQYVHTWMLGVIMAVLVVPQLHSWLG